MKGKLSVLFIVCLITMSLFTHVAHAAQGSHIVRIAIEKKDSFGMDGNYNLRSFELLADGSLACPDGTGTLHKNIFESLSQMVKADGFQSVPNNIETGVMDGHFTHIIIESDDGTIVRKGGLVAEAYGPQAFCDVYNAIMHAIEDVYEAGEIRPPVLIQPQTPKQWVLGNAPGNYTSEITVLDLDGCAIWTQRSPVRASFFIDPADKVTPLPFQIEQYHDGWFYYYRYNANPDEPNGIERCDVDGENHELLTDCRVVSWQVADGFLYVQEDIPLPYESYIPEYRLWRMNLETGDRFEYGAGNVDRFALSQQYLFTTDQAVSGCVRFDLNGENRIDLPINPYLFFYENDWLYYLAYNNDKSAAYRCKPDGTDIELLVQNAVGAINVDGRWLYMYQAIEDAQRHRPTNLTAFIRKNLSSGEEQTLIPGTNYYRDISLAGDFVFFNIGELKQTDKTPGSYKPHYMKKDGSTPVALG